ncbi:hypothetical protein GCM10007052_27300 [Halioglobus japonicus]|nr:hypothetical protein GCM10007052_27300 [Halioglobus japonicus]
MDRVPRVICGGNHSGRAALGKLKARWLATIAQIQHPGQIRREVIFPAEHFLNVRPSRHGMEP